MATQPALVDRFDRRITYVRLSVTDRCDFRCVYCMAEEMVFVPRAQILSLEEIALVARAFTELGVSKLRITGGEPLVRQGIVALTESIARLPGLGELTMTSNGARLNKFAGPLRRAGIDRLNISLDSLQPERFRQLTRTGKLEDVVAGIDAAIAAGFTRIKLNSVIMNGRNDDEVLDLVAFARQRQLDISFIEEMPLGAISEHDRALSFASSDELRTKIDGRYPLTATTENSGGPSRYYRMADSDSRIGFISPHSHNFCHLCNRVRVTAEGRLLLCLGNEHSVDLRRIIRDNPGDVDVLKLAIQDAMAIKPERHHFSLHEPPQILRFMNASGG